MTDRIEGFLEVGLNDSGKVVVNHPDLKPDENGVGHIVFPPNQAGNLANLLEKHASAAERQIFEKREAARIAQVPPVDRSARTMLNGSPETPDHREIDPSTGMQKDYIVLSAEERAKGFVRPVRRSYKHLNCGSVTKMGIALAETYARDPQFYSETFCVNCRTHYPLNQFVWVDGGEKLGS